MDLTIDAMGDSCPIPVVKAKKALKSIDEGTVEVLVDNDTAVTNLTNLAASLNCASTNEKKGDAEYVVRIVKDANSAPAEAETGAKVGPTIVVVGSQFMGSGDDALGAKLMKMFIFAITQLDELPDSMLFYNGGVHLTCEGSESLEDLQMLANAGVEIFSCGTCLQHYGIEDKLAVGQASNMYAIVEAQQNAGSIIRA